MQMKPLIVQQLITATSSDEQYAIIDNFFCENASYVPLEYLCVRGGSPDEDDTPDIHVHADVELTSINCTGTLTAYFNEKVYPAGCPDMPKKWWRNGDLKFAIALPSGIVSFP